MQNQRDKRRGVFHWMRVFAFIAFAATLHAEDWPQWRGPERSNMSAETDLLRQWPEGGPPLLWEAKGLGEEIASVAVADGTLYTLGYQGDRQLVFALDALTGDLRWTAPVGPLFRQSRLMRWLCQRTPTVDGDRLYAITPGGNLVCLQTSDGRELWRRNYATDFGAKQPPFGFSDYPLVDGEQLICTPGGPGAAMVALNKHTGDLLWKVAVPGTERPAYAAAIVDEFGGHRQYVNFLHHKLISVAPDGQLLWQHPMFRHPVGCTSTPIMMGDSRLLCPSGYDGAVALLEITGGISGFEINQKYEWTVRLDPFQDSTIRLGQFLYFWQRVSGPGCLDLDSGTLRWQLEDPSRVGRASVTYADGRLYYLRSDGVALLVEPAPEAYREKGRFTLPNYVDAVGATAPVVANGRLYLRDEDRLFCFDVRADAGPGPGAGVRQVDLGQQAITLKSKTPGSITDGGAEEPALAHRAIFVPTPADVVIKMLEMAAPKEGELVCDLGSGDGRILIQAARKYGCRALGYEIDPELVKKSRENVLRAGLDPLVRIEGADFATADLTEVDIVAVYLPEDVLRGLIPKFQQLRAGARIVSHQFQIPGMKYDRTERFRSEEDGEIHRIFYYHLKGEKVQPEEKSTGSRFHMPGRHDWPMYGRDATRNAVSAEQDPPRRWRINVDPAGNPEPEVNLKWKARIGLGIASVAAPVVSDGLVWIGSNNKHPRDPQRTEPAPVLMCFRESDGAFVWQYLAPVPKGVRSDWNWTGIKCSPLIEGDRLWFVTPAAEVVCLDIGPLLRGDGNPVERWKLNMPVELGVFVHPLVMGWPGSNSVASFGDWIYVITDNAVDWSHRHVPAPLAPSLVCLEKQTGKVVWEDNSPGQNIFHVQWSSPLALELEGEGRVFAGFGDGKLRAFAADTGRLIWELDCNPQEYRQKPYPAHDGPSEILAVPVYHDGRIYVSIGQEPDHGEGFGNLVCADARTGRLLWQNKSISRSLSSVVVVDKHVYTSDYSGLIYGLDAQTGAVRWWFDAKAHIWGSPMYVGGHLYHVDEDGDVMVFDLDGIERMIQEKGQPLLIAEPRIRSVDPIEGEIQTTKDFPVWQTHMGAPLYAPPVYANGVLYLNASPYLCAIASLNDPAPELEPLIEKPKVAQAVYVPTPQDVVERMLEMADVTATDLVVDLGSGDGRIVITAAKMHGARAVGYEIDPALVEVSRRHIADHHLADRVRIEQQDLFGANLEQADVVAMFLPPRLMSRLLPQLQQLKAGTRIVSHDFVFPEIPPENTLTVTSSADQVEHRIHLWTVPLRPKVQR